MLSTLFRKGSDFIYVRVTQVVALGTHRLCGFGHPFVLLPALQGDKLLCHAGSFLQGGVLEGKALLLGFGLPNLTRRGDEDGHGLEKREDQHGNLRHIPVYKREKQETRYIVVIQHIVGGGVQEQRRAQKEHELLRSDMAQLHDEAHDDIENNRGENALAPQNGPAHLRRYLSPWGF